MKISTRHYILSLAVLMFAIAVVQPAYAFTLSEKIIKNTGSADFNRDGEVNEQDVTDYYAVLAGRECSTENCYGQDYNGDGDTGTDQDIEAFWSDYNEARRPARVEDTRSSGSSCITEWVYNGESWVKRDVMDRKGKRVIKGFNCRIHDYSLKPTQPAKETGNMTALKYNWYKSLNRISGLIYVKP